MNFSSMKIVIGFVLVGLLAACGRDGQETAVSPPPDSTSTSSSPELTEAYDNALPVQSQLAIGTLQLEETDLAVDEALAAEILPLWQALQSLANSDTAAEAELTAVINQIEKTMKPEQIEAIAAMQLTQESLTALIEAGTITLGRGGFGGNNETGDAGGFALPAPGLGGGPGGGQGLGGGFPGGGPGGGQGNFSEDDIATRQAARESGDFSGLQSRVLVGAVIRLLEAKTGVESEPPADSFAAMWDVLMEATGLTIEEMQTHTADGLTLAELIEANGGDVESVKADMVESLQDSPIAQRQDLQEYVTNLLNNSGGDE